MRSRWRAGPRTRPTAPRRPGRITTSGSRRSSSRSPNGKRVSSRDRSRAWCTRSIRISAEEAVEHDGRPRRRARRHRVGIGERRHEHVRAAVRHHVQGAGLRQRGGLNAEVGGGLFALRLTDGKQAWLARPERLRRQGVVQPRALGAGSRDSGRGLRRIDRRPLPRLRRRRRPRALGFRHRARFRHGQRRQGARRIDRCRRRGDRQRHGGDDVRLRAVGRDARQRLLSSVDGRQFKSRQAKSSVGLVYAIDACRADAALAGRRRSCRRSARRCAWRSSGRGRCRSPWSRSTARRSCAAPPDPCRRRCR